MTTNLASVDLPTGRRDREPEILNCMPLCRVTV